MMTSGEYDEWDEEDDFEQDDIDEAATVACSFCGREIYEDAERCPYCENYVVAESGTSQRKPLWIIITALVCIYAMLHFYISALFFG
jgi:RNA polymerase subunit RPABC4/transcription elongation factor Spt4